MSCGSFTNCFAVLAEGGINFDLPPLVVAICSFWHSLQLSHFHMFHYSVNDTVSLCHSFRHYEQGVESDLIETLGRSLFYKVDLVFHPSLAPFYRM